MPKKISQKKYTSKEKPASKMQKKITNIEKRTDALAKKVNIDLSTHTYRRSTTDRVIAPESQVVYSAKDSVIMARIEQAMGALRFYDSTANTLDTSDVSVGGFNREIHVSSIFSKAIARNNYRVPAKVTIYCVVPKEDSNTDALVRFTNGMGDQGNPATTSPLIYPTDSDSFNRFWKIVGKVSKTLLPHAEMSLSHSCKGFDYNPAHYDEHALAYQRKFGCHQYLYRVQGVLAHDSILANEQGLSGAGIDIVNTVTYKIRYDSGGPKLNDFSIADGYDAFTNQPEVGVLFNANEQFNLN